jgi:carbonic anhydrase
VTANASAVFDDLLAANRDYAAGFELGDLDAAAARGLAVVTCIDSRIEPLAMLGLAPGDAKIIRNAGARVSDDAMRSLVLAVHLLAVHRVAVIAHTDCAMSTSTEDELRATIGQRAGEDATGWNFMAIADQRATLVADVERIRECPLLPDELVVAGFVYDVRSGVLDLVTGS